MCSLKAMTGGMGPTPASTRDDKDHCIKVVLKPHGETVH
jgi:hypothetical protein